MPVELSAKQRILRQIYESKGPHDLMMIMSSSRLARDLCFIQELNNEAADCEPVQPGVAQRLREMSNALELIHKIVLAFSQVVSISSLFEWYRLSPLCFSSNLFPMMQEFLKDAESAIDEPSANGFRTGLKIRESLVELVESLPTIDIVKQLEREPLLTDPAFHDFLENLSRCLLGTDDKVADVTWAIASHLRYVSRVRTVSFGSNGQKQVDGKIEIRIPTRPVDAELWFLISPDTATQLEALAAEVASQQISLEDGLDGAITIVRGVLDESVKEAGARLLSGTAFCEHLLRTGNSEIVVPALNLYRKLVEDKETLDLAAEIRGTSTLRYASAVCRSWRQLSDSEETLRHTVSMIEPALSEADEKTLPRLTRDLYFTRARLLENLAIRDPSQYTMAETDYMAGLAVNAVAHEAEARGRALGDLANTVAKRHGGGISEHDKRITSLFEEALRYLPEDESPLSRAVVLTSYAGYLMDRPDGEPILDLERSLEMTTQAIRSIENKIPVVERTRSTNELLAGAYVNRGNAIRLRSRGDMDENLSLAHESYLAALEVARKQKNAQLLGTVLMNMASASMDRYQLTGQDSFLRDADYYFSEAAGELREFPREQGYALYHRAYLATHTREQIDYTEPFKDVETAVRLLEASRAYDLLASAKSVFGILLKLRSEERNSADLERANQIFIESYDLFRNCGDLRGAIINARHSADVAVLLYRLEGHVSYLEQAAQILQRACEHVEEFWDRNDSMEWHAEVSLKYASTYEEWAWCEAMRRTDPVRVLELASLSSARELVSHVLPLNRSRADLSPDVADYLDSMRAGYRRAEISRWLLYQKLAPNEDAAATFRVSEEERARIRDRMSFFNRSVPGPAATFRSQIEEFLRANPSVIICHLVTTRWGSFAVFADAAGAKTFELPHVDIPTIRNWLHGDKDEPDWLHLVRAGSSERLTNRLEWARATERVLSKVGASIAGPIVSNIRDAKNRTLFLSPGFLKDIPIHAAELQPGGQRMFERFRGFAYVPSPAILRPAPCELTLRGPALCVLSDPASSSEEELRLVPQEVSEVANLLAQNSIATSVVAAVGSQHGREVLESRGMHLTESITILDSAPTRQWLLNHMSEFGHLFYSGHGVGGEGADSGLIVSDADGPGRLSNADVLEMRELALRPLVYLSACETAQEHGPSMEFFSFASTLIRSGAGFVLGTMWGVTDECSHMFSRELYKWLVAPKIAPEAFCAALGQLIEKRAGLGEDLTGVRRDHPIYWAGFVPVLGA